MHVPKHEIPAKIDVPGAVGRQAVNFGDATGFGKMGGEYFSVSAGADFAPLLAGLRDDACHSPHWGYMIAGEVIVTYTDGKVETCTENDLFFWPAGHTLKVTKDAEIVLFSPEKEHTQVMDHVLKQTQA